MPRVSSTNLSNRLSQYQDEALKHPVIITKNNRERLVIYKSPVQFEMAGRE